MIPAPLSRVSEGSEATTTNCVPVWVIAVSLLTISAGTAVCAVQVIPSGEVVTVRTFPTATKTPLPYETPYNL